MDNRNLVEFWKQVYNIEISPDEIPLLKIKMLNSENTFTYPASMCYFGNESLYIPLQFRNSSNTNDRDSFREYMMLIKRAVKDSRIGDDIKIQATSDIYRVNDVENIQRQILDETRQKLYGRNINARGSIMFVHDELWFFPNQIHIS